MKKLLNDGWEFLKTHQGSTAAEATGSDEWVPVDLPHDWLIWQSGNLYESADAWYRRRIFYEGKIPETCLLHFDGVYMDCDVLLNGKVICRHAYGYTAFYADLSSGIVPGENEILVHIRHQSPNSRWYSGSGIFRDVHLMELPAEHIVPDSFYLTEKQEGDRWSVRLSAETTGTNRGLFSYSVTDRNGNEITSGTTESIDGGIVTQIELGNAECWAPDHPVLYKLKYSYQGIEEEILFGLRRPEFTPDRGFFLNGKKIKLKGVCLHHDLGALGAAFHEKAARRQLTLMKKMGVNAIRTSHNPPAQKLLDLCDEMGFLVIDEAFDMWERPKTEYDYARFFPEDEEKDVALWIRRDRCHPCVILWSIGNEIYDMHADQRGTEVCRMLTEQVRFHDPEEHASVTFGCNYMPWEGGQRCAEIVKIAGYNYGEKLYAAHHEKHPDWVIYGSETASVLSSRGIYHFPIEKSIMSEADLQCSALGNSNTSWGALDLKEMIVEDLKCEYSLGQFIWSGIDYIGEPTPYHTRSCYFGQADTACYPKDAYYLFRSLWTDEPVLHIGVSWDWNPGQMIDVPVMTNFSRVELLLNGRSLGIRDVRRDDAKECLPVWKIPFEKGELTARALDEAGQILMEEKKVTSGDTARLVINAEEKTIRSDGYDLAFLTVSAEDTEGNPVENARDRIHIQVSGGAYLAGTDNGDSTDSDGYKQADRRLFGGKLLLILRSNGRQENAVISIRSSAGIEAEYVLEIEKCPMKPGISCIQRIPESLGFERIPARKIEITAEDSRNLDSAHRSCTFRWTYRPENAEAEPPVWQVTNDAGIETPYGEVTAEGDRVTVNVSGDGFFYLRGLGGNNPDHPELISQMEITAEGIGKPALNPYDFISAGLYDLHEGEIGTGNEKGIAFARDGVSMVGFSRVDFGKAGSDTLILPIFALDGKPYEIELLDGDPAKDAKQICMLHYEKPSIWNQYQAETYRLPERLTGIHTICFRMDRKVHMKGFRFERQSRAMNWLGAGEADTIYGDSFLRDGNAVRKIGNNVTLGFEEMDFGKTQECLLEIEGSTLLEVNAITIQTTGDNGETVKEIANFRRGEKAIQQFPIRVPGGMCTVSFIFLPGSQFDFLRFRFLDRTNGDF